MKEIHFYKDSLIESYNEIFKTKEELLKSL